MNPLFALPLLQFFADALANGTTIWPELLPAGLDKQHDIDDLAQGLQEMDRLSVPSDGEKYLNPTSVGLYPVQPARDSSSSLHDIDDLSDNCVCSENAVCVNGQCSCLDGFVDISPPDVPGFLCKPVTSVGCPPTYSTVEGSPRCFKVVEDHEITFDGAVEACERMNATIADIGLEIETMYLGHVVPLEVRKTESHKKAWIGLRRNEKTQEWEWVGGTASHHYLGWIPVTLAAEEKDGYSCALAVGGFYGKGYWIKAPCDDQSATGYVCTRPRTGDFVSEEEMVYRRFQITCCKGGTPMLDDNIMQYVDGWMSKKISEIYYCNTFQGAYRLPESVFEKDRGVSVRCRCTGENNDRNCRDSRPCENSGRRATSINRRCACVGSFFGELCEKDCKNGKLVKDENHIDSCECRHNYFGEECESIFCHNGYEQKGRFNRHCVCDEGFKGFEGGAFSQIIATTLPTILFFGILLAAYCACRKVMRSRRRRAANPGNLYMLPVRPSSTSMTLGEGHGGPHYNVEGLKPPPSYHELFGSQPGASTSGGFPAPSRNHGTEAVMTQAVSESVGQAVSQAVRESPPSTARDPSGMSEAPPAYDEGASGETSTNQEPRSNMTTKYESAEDVESLARDDKPEPTPLVDEARSMTEPNPEQATCLSNEDSSRDNGQTSNGCATTANVVSISLDQGDRRRFQDADSRNVTYDV